MRNVSLDIENFINNDPVLLIIFFSLSLFASIIKVVFSENDSIRKKKNSVERTLLKMFLTSLLSSFVIFSSLEVIRKYIKGNLIYLVVFFFGFICDLIIKQLVKFKSLNSLIKFIDELYTFLKSRKK